MDSMNFIFKSWRLNPYGQHIQQCLKLTLQRSHFETKNYEARILVKIKGYVYQETASCPGKRTSVMISSNRST